VRIADDSDPATIAGQLRVLAERLTRRPLPFVRIDRNGNARMTWAGYLLCARRAALMLGVEWWAVGLLYR
jgi:hypothetical protein